MTTKDFLSYFPKFCVQTFDDNDTDEKDNSLIRCGKPLEFTKDELKNLNKKGAGIYFTVNQFPEGRRRQTDCVGINAWYAESDTLPIEVQRENLRNSPLPPSFIVKSKKSLHAYWLAKDATKENFIKIQMGLRDKFQGDTTMKDIARVLRIPGFLHQKDRANPVLVEILEANPENKFIEADMLRAFPYIEKIITLPKQTKPVTIETFWTTLALLNNHMVLERLSGSEIINREIITFKKRTPDGEYIYVNGKICDAWIDAHGMIGSGKRGGPTWIQWISFYGKSKAEIAQWAKIYLSEFIPEELKTIDNKPIKIETALSLSDEIKKDFSTPPTTLTWGMEYLDYKLPILDRGRFVVMFGQQGSGKSLFCVWMAKKNTEKNPNVCFLSLEMGKKQIIRNYILQRADIDKESYRKKNVDKSIVDKFLPEIQQIQFIGIEDGEIYDIAKIEKIIQSNKPSILFIDNLNKIRGVGKSEIEITQGTTTGLLGLTRKYDMPIILIHHANKPMEKKKGDSQYNLRGLAGLRGSNKTSDDADIIIEVSRPQLDMSNPLKNNTTYLASFKDRDFDTRTLATILFEEGNFYDIETSSLGKTIEQFEGELIPNFKEI